MPDVVSNRNSPLVPNEVSSAAAVSTLAATSIARSVSVALEVEPPASTTTVVDIRSGSSRSPPSRIMSVPTRAVVRQWIRRRSSPGA